MLALAVTVLTAAAAFSPPPVPTDTLPAESAGAVGSYRDASGDALAVMPWEVNRFDSVQSFLDWFGEGVSGKEG